MARGLAVIVLCLCLSVAFAADLRKLIAERASLNPQPAAGQAGKSGDLDTANSFWGPGFGGFYGGWGPWGYGWGGPWGYGGYGGYGGFGWGGGWW